MSTIINFNKPVFSWSVNVGNNQGDNYHITELIADNDNLVLDYLKRNFNIDEMQDTSFDMDSFSFEITTFYDKDGNQTDTFNEENYDEDLDNSLTEYVTADKEPSPLSESELKYLLSGKYHCQVVDLTA